MPDVEVHKLILLSYPDKFMNYSFCIFLSVKKAPNNWRCWCFLAAVEQYLTYDRHHFIIPSNPVTKVCRRNQNTHIY